MSVWRHDDALHPISPHASARRQQILEAAIAAMARKGFHDTSIADIAALARGSRATVCQYFGDKRDILSAIGRRVEEAILAAIDAWMALPSGATGDDVERSARELTERLRAMIDARIGQVIAALSLHADAARLVLCVVRGKDGLDDVMRRIDGHVVRMLAADIRTAIDRGWVRSCDVEVTARYLLGGIEKMLMDAPDPDRRSPSTWREWFRRSAPWRSSGWPIPICFRSGRHRAGRREPCRRTATRKEGWLRRRWHGAEAHRHPTSKRESPRCGAFPFRRLPGRFSMQQTLTRAGLATAAFVAGMLAAPATYAQGTLGFTIDPTEGVPGTTVTGQVNVADVQATCATDVTALQAEFQALLDGPFAGGGPTGDLFHRFFPDDEFVFENCDQAAYSLTGITALGIAFDIGGAAETALPQTFVMTFVDPATLDPIGELGSFDPTTGVGSVVVPNVTPGVWPIAATCVQPSLDVDVLEAGIRENGAFLESLNPPTCDINDPAFSEWVVGLLGEGADIFLFLQTFGPTFVQNIVVPDGLGLQFFTVLATPSQRIGDVIGDIQALVTAGDITAGQARALIQVLTNALRSFEREGSQSACSQLAAFEAVATAKVTAGQLDDSAAQSLIAEVQSIREQLGCEGTASPSGAFLD